MKHYVLLKLAAGTDPVKIQEKIWKTFRKLDDELDWLNHPVVYRSCRDGAPGFDMMTVFEIEAEEQLDEYLAHPLTRRLAEEIGKDVKEKATFDHY